MIADGAVGRSQVDQRSVAGDPSQNRISETIVRTDRQRLDGAKILQRKEVGQQRAVVDAQRHDLWTSVANTRQVLISQFATVHPQHIQHGQSRDDAEVEYIATFAENDAV